MYPSLSACHIYFYPRSPCGERHGDWLDTWDSGDISIHALLAESDAAIRRMIFAAAVFLSTLSLRRATLTVNMWFHTTRISIHALLAESDLCNMHSLRYCCTNFYPRSPCGERRNCERISPSRSLFLSTLSLRRATRFGRVIDVQFVFLSTLSLRRATG